MVKKKIRRGKKEYVVLNKIDLCTYLLMHVWVIKCAYLVSFGL